MTENAITRYEQPTAVVLGTLKADSPAAVLDIASQMATPLAGIIKEKKLFTEQKGKKYVHCEGWTTLAAMCGVMAREVEVVEKDGVYTAVVALVRIADNQELSRASAECGAGEEIWMKRPAYARRSMAITRATGKVCRICFSWVMVMAGYEATPHEEIEGVADHIKDKPPKPAPEPFPPREAPQVKAAVDKLQDAGFEPEIVEDEDLSMEEVYIFDFGKHTGKPITQVPQDYLAWLAKKIQEDIANGKSKDPEKQRALLVIADDELTRRQR